MRDTTENNIQRKTQWFVDDHPCSKEDLDAAMDMVNHLRDAGRLDALHMVGAIANLGGEVPTDMYDTETFAHLQSLGIIQPRMGIAYMTGLTDEPVRHSPMDPKPLEILPKGQTQVQTGWELPETLVPLFAKMIRMDEVPGKVSVADDVQIREEVIPDPEEERWLEARRNGQSGTQPSASHVQDATADGFVVSGNRDKIHTGGSAVYL